MYWPEVMLVCMGCLNAMPLEITLRKDEDLGLDCYEI